MNPPATPINRRSFVKVAGLAGAGALCAGLGGTLMAEETKPRLRLGFDNFSVRAMNWKAPQLLDYAASLKLDSMLISDLDAYESFDSAYLKDVGQKARSLGILLHAGTWSICPTSKFFKNKWGTAEEHLALGIRVAHDLGSTVLRVIVGKGEDRATPGGIEARIKDTAKVCQQLRGKALDANVKIAVENHAGDMQAWEVLTLIEQTGPEYVGVTLDSGNACWSLEDPLESLETLAPFVLTTGLRDSMVWESPLGAKVQWTATGEGIVDQKAYFARFAQLCPNVPANFEIISGFSREYPYLQKEFWKVYPKARAQDFAGFLALAKKGHEIPPHHSADAKAEQDYQRSELERSLRYAKEILGLGQKV